MFPYVMQENHPNRSLLVLATLLAFVYSQQTHANEQAGDVEFLYRSCKQGEKFVGNEKLNDGNIASAAYCIGYLKGIYHMHLVNCPSTKKSDAKDLQREFDTSPAALIHSFVRWAEQNPRHWNESELIAFAVIRQDFPCK